MYPYKYRKGKIINAQLDEITDLNNLTATLTIKENGLFKFKKYKKSVSIINFEEVFLYQDNKIKFWTKDNEVISLRTI